MSSKVKVLRSTVAGKRPTGKEFGELWVNDKDKVMGYIDSGGQPVVPFALPSDIVIHKFDATVAYRPGDVVLGPDGELWSAKAAVVAGAWDATKWNHSGDSRFVNLTGDTMTGALNLPTGVPTGNNAVSRTEGDKLYVNLTGDTMTGALKLPTGVPTGNQAVSRAEGDKLYINETDLLTSAGSKDVTAAIGALVPKVNDVVTVTKAGTPHASWAGMPGPVHVADQFMFNGTAWVAVDPLKIPDVALGDERYMRSQFLQAGTDAVARTSLSKLRDTVSVKDFGAVGDGVADDTKAIQAALNAIGAGVCLRFGNATFKVSDALTVTSKTDFQIDGEGATIIAANGMAVAASKELLYLTNCQRFTVKNFTFDGNRANRTPAEVPAHTVTLTNCKRFIFENVHSNNAVVDGFYFAATDNTDTSTYCQYFQMIGCYANNCYRQGASVVNGYDFQFIGGAYTNTTGTAPQAGIDVESNVGATVGNTRGAFIGVTFSGNAGPGLQLSDAAGSKVFSVEHCYFSQNAGGGVAVFTDQTKIRDSYFSDHTGAGVTQGVVRFTASTAIKSGLVDGCSFENNSSTTGDIYTHTATSGIRITNNRIQGSGGVGIFLNGTNHVVANNVVSNCAGSGVSDTGVEPVVQNNTIDACGGRGIYSSAARPRILSNKVSNISSVSGAYIQAAGTDPLVVGNICSSASPVSDYGIRIDKTALAVYSNVCVNLNSTDPYTFVGTAIDDIVYNNIGGTANDRRRVRFGMAIPSYATGARPAANDVAAGQTIFNTTTNKLNTSDGSANWYNADGTTA